MSNKTVLLNNARSTATKAAAEIGLLDMMRSKSLQRFAESISGYNLEPHAACQIIRYEPGDYVGPHNDHHPEQRHLRDGYVDLHIALSTESVDHQWLVYERQGHFTEILNVGIRSSVLVSYLPFWHYTTPLVARKNEEHNAMRWLLLASFVIEGRG